MHINFRCSKCDTVFPVLYETLVEVWKVGYDQMPDDKKSIAYLTAQIECTCGHSEKFASPMFRYTFQTAFEEFLGFEV